MLLVVLDPAYVNVGPSTYMNQVFMKLRMKLPLAPTLRVSALDVAWDPSRAGFGTSRGLGPFTPMSRHACLKGFRTHSLASVDAVANMTISGVPQPSICLPGTSPKPCAHLVYDRVPIILHDGAKKRPWSTVSEVDPACSYVPRYVNRPENLPHRTRCRTRHRTI